MCFYLRIYLNLKIIYGYTWTNYYYYSGNEVFFTATFFHKHRENELNLG